MQSTASASRDEGRTALGAQMAKVGVRLLNRYGQVLECEKCGEQWTPQQAADGSLPRGFWHCPNKCNW
jgi:hypothetical protein